FVVALEGKGPTDPLDRPYSGRKMSAVDQGYRYAINLPCDWIIVTSMRQTRLYFKGADQYTYERFDTERLATDDSLLKRFLFLLGAERVVPEKGDCHLFGLLTSSEKVGKELTKEFYFRYAEMRQNAFEQLCSENPDSSRDALLTATQKLLDRVLFCAFCEDRGLLPANTIQHAYEHRDPYQPKPIWENFRGLFRAIDTGNAGLNIPAYNGGLFAHDKALDDLKLSDAACGYFRDLGTYDYRPATAVSAETDEAAGQLIDVDILGHIFEQSITDLERLRNIMEGRIEPLTPAKLTSRRKKEGAFYTPVFITRYIVEQALGSVLKDRFEELRTKHEGKAKGTAKTALADPAVYQLDALKEPQRKALVTFWESWQDELKSIRIVDPACGSGSMLIEAFDQLHMVYQISNDRLEELRGSRSLFDPDRQILQHNLYGVDLNEEAVEICRLSLWIKTAARGKVLTSLDHTIRVGNSVVTDSAVHPRAFDWQAAFPEVFANGGFDVVIGNPPYVRQEWISDIKPHLEANYLSYHGMADLYVYFYELGCRILKPGGRLSFVVTNKWMKAGYGEPLRRYFAEHVWTEQVVDFGHAKQIFEDADVFPSIIVVRKPTSETKPEKTRVCCIARETLRVDDLNTQIVEEGFDLNRAQLGSAVWQLQDSSEGELLQKLNRTGIPLHEFAGVETLRGVTTGLNDAFLIDTATRNRLVLSDPNCDEIIKPYVRGQDICRWEAEWAGLWMIFARRGIEIDSYPSVKQHLQQYRERLEPKPPGWNGTSWPGRKGGAYSWYEVQDTTDYWQEFSKPKIVYPEITWRSQWSLDTKGTFSSNTVYFVPTDDLWILAVANAPVSWWRAWRTAVHGKDEALRYIGAFVREIPIPHPSELQRQHAERWVRKLIEASQHKQVVCASILDWLAVEYGIDKSSKKLQDPIALDSDSFVAEVKKLRGKSKPLTAAALKALRDEDAQTLAPARVLAAEAMALENQLSDLVNAAYGLTPDEIQLMWKTAPPRMPLPRPS
ncbi:MAG TPA: N-6 DNA methylase, partial [Planctomycetaceae bacterium]|nr:N-6 DNA methylase [Planctomycetaceae bacterium]